MVIHPNLSLCPIYHRCSRWGNYTSIFTNKDINAIKDIISHPVLNTICSIIRVWSWLPCSLGYWFPFPIKDITAFHKWSILHTIRTASLYQFFQLTHNSALIGVLQ